MEIAGAGGESPKIALLKKGSLIDKGLFTAVTRFGEYCGARFAGIPCASKACAHRPESLNPKSHVLRRRTQKALQASR